ncbi:SCO-spondin [Polyodon spathula]|uniref:SCO-spondin n=1 Tax=Polyodon spathula TaxID=7913 RepID=UPI001B7E219B|nr:SCO-spondin [Polyodon spathula]
MFPTQHKCAAGTWSERTDLVSASECSPCPRGWYCLTGAGLPSGRCSSGHYCPEGTQFGSQFPCPAGTYSTRMGNGQKDDCRVCPEGSYCTEGSAKPTPCPVATYRSVKGGKAAEDCTPCPAGYHCPRFATIKPRACGTGSYSDHGSALCLPCLPGHYCSNETTSQEAMLSVMVCPAGLICTEGLDREPQRATTLCPKGYYCPGGDIDPNPRLCPNGTYSDRQGLREVSACTPCPAGQYCFSKSQGISRPTGSCPSGYHCPVGTGYPYSFPCTPGSYRNSSLGHRGETCQPCPAGFYCASQATEIPTICPRGYFCVEGSSSPEPCEEGTYSARPALRAGSECAPCVGGWYCAGVGLTEPTGSCEAGFYCRERARSATPADGHTGGLCPIGSYCPAGSAFPLPCPPGTFSNATGLSRPGLCVDCTPGYHCSGSNVSAPAGLCSPGYYCTGGASSPNQHETQEGHYTLPGAFTPEPCALGTFQPARGQSSCLECLRGRFCNQTGLARPFPCPPGHYCLPGTVAPTPCPAGSYTAQEGAGDTEQCVLCDPGQFCSMAGLSAPMGPCKPGYYCTGGANSSMPVNMPFGDLCPAGFFCPSGTRHPFENPCPPGTWNNGRGGWNQTSCWLCPPGHYCHGTGLAQPSALCAPGFYCSGGAETSMPVDGVSGDRCPKGLYCPKGSVLPLPCPDGSYTNITGAAECLDCPAGYYCLSGQSVQLCPEGHYCPGGTGLDRLPCPPGTYSPEPGNSQLEQCLLCPAGMYCEDWGLSVPTGSCQAGYFCLAGMNFRNPDGNISTGVGGPCPRGHYCPAGTSLPVPCPLGTFSSRLHVEEESGCSACPPGVFCGSEGLSQPTGPCREGFHCPGGAKSPLGSEGTCPVSHYCPAGSAQPLPCPAGTYNNLTGQAKCFQCGAGYYCPEKATTYSDFPCPPGFYCPDGTRHATQFPCPRGYYNPEPMTQSLDSCLPCPPGRYCEKERLTAVSGMCKAGWFCISAAWNSQPFDLDNYTNANCLCPATATGGKCQEGYYCPSGSSEPIPCPPGAYCNGSGLSRPSGSCSAGYYCSGRASQPNPTDKLTGNRCPPGSFCGFGSGDPQLCLPGTFSRVQGLVSESECLPCTEGFYCETAGLVTPSGPCRQGYFCPPGQRVSTGFACPLGHYCPEGSPAPVICESGSYQNLDKQAACKPCEEGYYCNNSLGPVEDPSQYPCPQGHYCPQGTRFATQYGCPVGTFNPRVRVQDVSGCLPCPPGKYCSAIGLAEPTGDCLAGFWCKQGAQTRVPSDGLSGGTCSPGHYCPSGTPSPVPCPLGTVSNSTGGESQDECQPCSGGFYCDRTGLTAPTGPCAPGFYCSLKSVTPTPAAGNTGGPCPVGHFCPPGTAVPVPCLPGTYMTGTQASECVVCPAGKYCITGMEPLVCPKGFYCPEGTGYDWQPCTAGSYSPEAGLSALSQCGLCDGGRYCALRNATAATGECREGYYCLLGSRFPQPESDTPGQAGPCPVGHFCPRGTATPQPCPLGTFSNLTKQTSEADCIPCLPGHFCGSAGLTAPTGECWEGFYCSQGATVPNSPIRDSRGGPCPTGHFCPKGSAAPQPCPEGTYCAVEGQASCSPCVEGYYCPVNSSSYAGTECAPGHYCPTGTSSWNQIPCPAGTYNPFPRGASLQDCIPCEPGLYCASPGLPRASGQCAAGHYCVGGAVTPHPSNGITGDMCPRGHYCSEGSAVPQPCPPGHYSNTTKNTALLDCLPCPQGFSCDGHGLSAPSGSCQAGYFCPPGQNSSRPASYTCATGHMCPQGSSQQSPCPPGTYQDQRGQALCKTCTAGFSCAGTIQTETGLLVGTQNPDPCPKGHYCPPGTKLGTEPPCPAGTFNNRTGLSDVSECVSCPAGEYCSSAGLSQPTGPCITGFLCFLGAFSPHPLGDSTGRICTPGFYCPQGTTRMLPCPAGTFSTLEGAGSQADCRLCPPGLYCQGPGLSAPSGSCSAGFYCTGGAKSPAPTDNTTGYSCEADTESSGGAGYSHMNRTTTALNPREGFTGNVCPAGHFCPAGSSLPSPCPPGTFLARRGAQLQTECQSCVPGSYCSRWGRSSPESLCPEGWFCPEGSVTGEQSAYRCPPGHACPMGSAEPMPCPSGSYQPAPRQSSCRPCPPGLYCLWGCSSPSPCPLGSVSGAAGLQSELGCSPCPPGFHCNRTGLTAPTGPCTAGYYCSHGSKESSPVNQTFGDVCPRGHYCPEGSSQPVPCPAGTYQPATHRVEQRHCLPCPPGAYCSSEGSGQETGLCLAGYYCTGGAVTPTPLGGPTEHSRLIDVFCKLRTPANIFCMNGSCSNGTKAQTCFDWCSAGPCCDGEGGAGASGSCSPGWSCLDWTLTSKPCSVPTIRATLNSSETLLKGATCGANFTGGVCPKGFYCPEGSAWPVPCDFGQFCHRSRLSLPTGPCAAGFYCGGGASVPNPTACPPGHYCPQGTPNPLPCLPGSFNTFPGGSTSADCRPCLPGHYCGQHALAAPSGVCAAGYYCPGGQNSSRPMYYPCSPGHFCTEGSSNQTSCPSGTYQAGWTQSACEECPAGLYCQGPGVIHPAVCPVGSYCPPGCTSANQYLCPPGSYGNRPGLAKASDCSPCDPGMYCMGSGSTRPSGLCSPGFYCTGGSAIPAPGDGVMGDRCRAGFYCPRGSATEQACPAGTFSNRPGLSDSAQCQACSPGHFCTESGQPAVSGPCLAGFYCLEGSRSSTPILKEFGGVCSPGHFCPNGTALPVPCPTGTYRAESGGRSKGDCTPCPAGSYQGLEGQRQCDPCPPGFYCRPQALHAQGAVIPQPCPAGHFCPRETEFGTQKPCPQGTHSRQLGLTSAAECSPCPAGYFCGSEGLVQPTGPCAPGFYCTAGAWVPNPSDDVTGAACPRGKYCQAGSVSGSCFAGFYCDLGSSRPDQKICPWGFYCPNGTGVPVPCEAGTYSSSSGNSQATDCRLCPSGMFCQGDANTAPGGLCSEGFYCPPGQISSRPTASRCPRGHYCPAGSAAPKPCGIGTFQPREEQGSCDVCPAGFYCHPSNDSGVVRPEPCPQGYFCPPGTQSGTESPCPRGTIGPQAGAGSPAQCQPCPAGMYCAFPGLSEPTGPCHAGFFCSGGASSPNSSEYMVKSDGISFAGNSVCPVGHFCPAGTGYPLPCPAGSFSSSPGLKGADQCERCPPGYHCHSPGLAHQSQTSPCDAGYVCLGGSATARPTDGLHGYRCPSGFSCPAGAGIEVPCEPGTYSPMPGASVCLPCPAGTMCNSTGTEEPSLCPRGYYCPPQTALPLPCPAGTLSSLEGALSVSACVPCPAGLYCRGEANTGPDGPCLPGYYCQGGAVDAVPQGSAVFPKNGPCPLGHYCPAAALAPVPCPLGSIKNTTGGSSLASCLPCPAGHYCSSEGLSMPSGHCSAGFYCPSAFTSISPNAFLCPKGHHCPPGSAHPHSCPTGEYQPNPGSDYCIPCRPGFYCEEAIAGDPRPCPPHTYCPAATQVPQLCPNGTFTPTTMSGLQEERECLPCPSGKFCRGGKIQGSCAAGFLCLSGSSEFTPRGSELVNRTSCEWGEMCAGPCPAGFYCPEGTKEPRACPAHTVRASPGASQRDHCLPCPPQYWCKEGDPVRHLCPAGHYCNGLKESDPQIAAGPRECPVHTYRADPGAGSRGDCLTCPAGYHCNSTGIIDYVHYPCPPGFWCPWSGSPVLCPAGTMRTEPGSTAVSQCDPCTAGFYCPDPMVTGQPNIHGIPCRASYECPPGAVTEVLCRAGSYCGPQTGTPSACPGGYFCPEGSQSYNTPAQLCVFPFYCPPSSSRLLPCDGGFMPVNASGLRDSLEKSCVECRSGTYRPSLESELHCLPCPAGYHCPQGTEHYMSNSCPIGYYCPAGTALAVPCPPGSYGNSTQAKHRGECYPCPADTFNHLFGQKACFPCGSSSFSLPGADSCTCRGLNRAFQQSDGSCICRAGYVYYNELDQKRSTGNSDMDCQSEVNERCGPGEVRLASTRECVLPGGYDCTAACGSQGGNLAVELGICHCAEYVSAEELCNASCLSEMPKITASLGPNGQLVLNIKDGEARGTRNKHVVDTLGPEEYSPAAGSVHIVHFAPHGVFGLIVKERRLLDVFLSGESTSSEVTETPDSLLRNRRSSEHVAAAPRIPNPIACLKPNDMIIFQLSLNHRNRSRSHFPVYQKDHLFNSNPSWDSGAFRRLGHLIKETRFNVSRFAHVFSEPGKYVLLDNAAPERSLIVVVSEHHTECESRSFQPSSPGQLVRHGVLKQRQLNLVPNWGAIAGVLCLLALAVAVLTVSALVLKPVHAGLSPWRIWKPKWRSLGEPCIPPGYIYTRASLECYDTLACRGEGEGAEIEEESAVFKAGKRPGEMDLEDFNVRTLYDKLEDQNLHLAAQLSKHRSEMLDFYKSICQQTEALKETMEGMDPARLAVLEKKWVLFETPGLIKRIEDQETSSPTNDKSCSSAHLLEALLRGVEDLLFGMSSENLSIRREEAQRHCGIADCLSVSSVPSHLGVDTGHAKGSLFQDPSTSQQPAPKQTLTADTGESFPDTGEACLSGQQLQVADAGLCSLSDQELGDLITATPLSSTLQQILESLRDRHAREQGRETWERREAPRPQTEAGELVPVDLEALTPQNFTVFLFGRHIVRLLCSTCSFPPVTLLLAQTVPDSSGTAHHYQYYYHYTGYFYYDTCNRILYLHTAKLDNLGEFSAVLLHTMAHISAGSQPREKQSAVFIREFHKAISAVCAAFFHAHYQVDTWEDAKEKGDSCASTAGSARQSVFEDFMNLKVPPERRFSKEMLEERLKKFRSFLLHLNLRAVMKQRRQTEGRHAVNGQEETEPEHRGDSALQARIQALEEETDGLNEDFLQLTTQLLEQKEQGRQLEEKLEALEQQTQDAHDTVRGDDFERILKALAQGREEALMLALKRHCVSQRLSEIETDLSALRVAVQ